jgi:hypothetical protein
MTDEAMTQTEIPIACSLTTPELRVREQAVQREIVAGVREARELADGYALRFPGDAAWLGTLAEFIRFERECCPFFTFELRCEPQQGPFWLHLRGPEGVKEFVATLLALPVATDTSTRQGE